MNKKILAAVIASTMAVSANAADVDIYGKVNLTLHAFDDGDESIFEVKNNASRIGFKGEEATENGLTVVYQYELGVSPDTKEDKGNYNDTFTQRNSFLGVKGDFGLVKVGTFDTPFKSAQGKIDVFGDLVGDIAEMLTKNDQRLGNSVAYSTPSLSGFKGNIQYIASEDAETDSGVSASATFSQGGVYLALAHDSNVKEEDTNATRLVGAYTFNGVQLGGLYETREPADDTDSVDAWLVSAKVAINKLDLKAQYGASDIKEEGGTTTSVGLDYRMTKNFTITSYISSNESDAGTEDTFVGAGGILKF
ncbi:porin [Teredinibacter haidensis]|uniref:porin n=1 Tax=Teredinibacter haidensis TaxID=2731755 RepID=UPI000948DA60|nr:porin [Teredinibacter haidensis]